jgi:heme exporter protein A
VKAGAAMLEAVHLTKRLGERMVLRDVSLTVPAGSVAVVLGPNGAGKSTLLKIAAGVWTPTGGRLNRFGQVVEAEATDARIGYLGHRSFLYGMLSGLENLAFYARLYGVRHPRQRAQELLREIGLSRFQNVPVRRYSRGMEQRVAIARAFVASPQLLLLDEPYTGLDVAAANLLDGWIRRTAAGGGAALLITHHLDEAARVGDRVSILQRGLVDGSPIHRAGMDEAAFHAILVKRYHARFLDSAGDGRGGA